MSLKRKSEKRTTEEGGVESDSFSRPLHGLEFFIKTVPSSKLLGYFHSSAGAD
jgi:hypothetical protein